MNRAAEAAVLQPHYFGDPAGHLFGCYHAPAGGAVRSDGVLLCSPVGHEYMACHRAMRQLALRLAQSGRPVLRFDLYGSGDSAGDSADGCPSHWLRDIAHATRELQRRQAGSEMSVLGLRLGATLALLHCEQADAAELPVLILWNPIVDGRAYVAELIALQRERFGTDGDDEVLGFPFTRTLRTELERIDLLTLRSARARRVLVIETGPDRSETRALESRLRETGSVVEYRNFDVPGIWDDPHKTAVPNAVIQFIASWMNDARECRARGSNQ